MTMKELRKEWSYVPAVPSIAWPMGDAKSMGADAGSATLADLDDEAPTCEKALIIVDGFAPFHGRYISFAAREVHGAAAIHVLSDFMTRYLHQVEGETAHLASRMPDPDDEEEVAAWASRLPPSLEVCGVYCESDSGLGDAERLGAALGLHPRRHDGVNPARRDKFLMNRAAAAAGLDVVRQKSCRSLAEAEAFARELGLGEDGAAAGGRADAAAGGAPPPSAVVKPRRGVASDDVHLCPDLPALRRAFAQVLGSPVFGAASAARHDAVLVQEFAAGTEYAVDVVCRDGARKAAALWRYDKRAANGAPFVYHATRLASADDPEGVEAAVCRYAFAALDALGVRWGLSHVEVIAEVPASGAGPARVRLVEVNCRQHNTDFAPLTDACVGYNALDLLLAAHLGADGDEDKGEGGDRGQGLPWDAVPALPVVRAHGAVVHFVSHAEGTLSRVRHEVLAEMEGLASVMDMHVYPQFLEVGAPIRKTVDIRSDSGWAHIMNDDKEVFESDYARLVELMKTMFEVEEE